MILIVDFGSQFNQLIARKIRELNVYCQIVPYYEVDVDFIKSKKDIDGIILSGGPASIYEKNSPQIDKKIFSLNIPILGICYGMQLMVSLLGGKIEEAGKREYGFAELIINKQNRLFKDVTKKTVCWMSHGDSLISIPKSFEIVGNTKNTKIAAIENKKENLYGLQFHPEVAHTEEGLKMLGNFLFEICRCSQDWTMSSFIKDSIKEIKNVVQGQKVILGLSGGVDSSVAATLIHNAIGKDLTSIFIDNGLLRLNEAKNLKKTFKENFDLNIRFINAGSVFLKALKGVTDPEKKRKIIGRLFIKIFNEEAKKIKGASFLAQGTLYPDIIESKSAFGGPSSVIKSHHNVGGLPKKMKLKLLEPLKFLFKDEVRLLGKELNLSDDIVWRQPFPGPGLSIRIIGAITKKKLDILRKADALLMEEIKNAGYYKDLWQAFVVLLPIKSVGVMGDKRTYENIAAIRIVNSLDAMTADWAKLPHEFLAKVSNRIINEIKGINRVVYDISSKPPSTIEWE